MMFRCGETLYQCSPQDLLSGLILAHFFSFTFFTRYKKSRFYGDQDLYLNLPQRSSSKVKLNSVSLFAKEKSPLNKSTQILSHILGGDVLPDSLK